MRTNIKKYSIGLFLAIFLLIGSTVYNNYLHIPDFINGFTKGFGIIIFIFSISKMYQTK